MNYDLKKHPKYGQPLRELDRAIEAHRKDMERCSKRRVALINRAAKDPSCQVRLPITGIEVIRSNWRGNYYFAISADPKNPAAVRVELTKRALAEWCPHATDVRGYRKVLTGRTMKVFVGTYRSRFMGLLGRKPR